MDTPNRDQQQVLPQGSRARFLSSTMIAGQISTLLSHYWSASENEVLRQNQAKDWLSDLIEFSPPVVAEACREWRRSQSKRPMISDIRGLCKSLLPKQTANEPRYLPSGDVHGYVADRKRVYNEAHDKRERWAQERGLKDFGEAIQIGIIAAGRRKATRGTEYVTEDGEIRPYTEPA